MVSKNILGARGEELVAEKYLDLGFSIVSRRYRTPYGEIDLIVKKDKLVVFVEVKTRQEISDEYISKTQVRRNSNAANFFIYTYDHYQNYNLRFDLAIVINSKVHDIIENAWTFDAS